MAKNLPKLEKPYNQDVRVKLTKDRAYTSSSLFILSSKSSPASEPPANGQELSKRMEMKEVRNSRPRSIHQSQ